MFQKFIINRDGSVTSICTETCWLLVSNVHTVEDFGRSTKVVVPSSSTAGVLTSVLPTSTT